MPTTRTLANSASTTGSVTDLQREIRFETRHVVDRDNTAREAGQSLLNRRSQTLPVHQDRRGAGAMRNHPDDLEVRKTWGISVFRIKELDGGRLQAMPELETSYDSWMKDNLGSLDPDKILALNACRPIWIGDGAAPLLAVVAWERSAK